MDTANYNEDLRKELERFGTQNEVTPELVNIFMAMTKRILDRYKSKNISDEEYQDIEASCVLDCVKFCPMYNKAIEDPTKNRNPHAYFTHIIKSTLAKEYKRTSPRKP